MAELPRVSEPAWLSKFTKVLEISFKNISSQSNADTENLIGVSESLSCCCRKIPVTSDEVESVAKIVNVEIEIAKASILLCHHSHFAPHFSVDAHAAHGLMINAMHCLVNLFWIMGKATN